MAEEGLQWDDGMGIAIALLAGVLFLIALRAYARTRTLRVLLFASAFGVLFLKGVLLAAEVFFPAAEPALSAAELVADAAVLLLFFFGMLKG